MVLLQKKRLISYGWMTTRSILKIFMIKTLHPFVVKAFMSLVIIKDTRLTERRRMRGNGDSAERKRLYCNSFVCI